MKLTKIPIVIYYGDYIPSQPMDNPGQDMWRIRLVMARLWRDAVNRYGGDATASCTCLKSAFAAIPTSHSRI